MTISEMLDRLRALYKAEAELQNHLDRIQKEIKDIRNKLTNIIVKP